ncbi:hypothetical protein, variant 3 [Aphanomyces invadans]|uniref:Uncharacterized protein n=2 Tax=Aphanomyces invadans TaxID=157072 RepID=A0A024U770_9STRA|nr:hypothetical protein, variant 3 [Aphanomyces invadans]ETW02124.1 hypothetical protein, variant 3 [Aphanomyces invadans]|eukprot:XP_008868729.1 hypothetical protein, variant 3 [Aphanomyces invadans]
MLRPANLDGCKKPPSLRPLGSSDDNVPSSVVAERTLLNAQLRGSVLELQRQLVAVTAAGEALQEDVHARTVALAQHDSRQGGRYPDHSEELASALQRNAALSSKTKTLELEIADLSRHLDRLARSCAAANVAATRPATSPLHLASALHVDVFVRTFVKGSKASLAFEMEWTEKDMATLTDAMVANLPLLLTAAVVGEPRKSSPKFAKKNTPNSASSASPSGELPQVENASPRRRRPRSDSVHSAAIAPNAIPLLMWPPPDNSEPALETPPSSANSKLPSNMRGHRQGSSERIRWALLSQTIDGTTHDELDSLMLPGLGEAVGIVPAVEHSRTPRPGGFERSKSGRHVDSANTIEKSLHPGMHRAGSRVIRENMSAPIALAATERPSLSRRPSSKQHLQPALVPIVDAAVMPAAVHPTRHVTADEMEHVVNVVRRPSLRGSTTNIRASPPIIQEPPSPPKPVKCIPRLAMVEPFEFADLQANIEADDDRVDTATAPTLTPTTSRGEMEIYISPPRPHFDTLNLSASHAAMRDTPRPEPEDSTARSSVDGSTSQRGSPPRLAPLLQTSASTVCFNTSRESPPRQPKELAAPASLAKQRTSKLLARIIPATTYMDSTSPTSMIDTCGSTAVMMTTSSSIAIDQSSPPRQSGVLGSVASAAMLPLKASPPKQPADSPIARNMDKSPSASRRGLFPSPSRTSMEWK